MAKRKPGRPRSPHIREKALKAASELLRAGDVDKLTIESVAAMCGSGKPTLYRHWSNARELAMDALMADTDVALAPVLETSPRAAMIRQLDRMVELLSPPHDRHITRLLAESDSSSDMGTKFRTHVYLKARASAREALAEFMERGVLKQDLDLETVLDLLFGPIFLRVLCDGTPPEKSLPTQVVNTVFAAIDRPATLDKGYP